MSLRAIEGQDLQAELILGLVKKGMLPHALLFTGIPGVGRLRAAIALAMALNCASPRGHDACGRCDSCTRTLKNSHPDVFVVWPDPPKTKKDKILKDDPEFLLKHRDILKSPWPQGDDLYIRIDTVREIIRDASIRPVMGKYRVIAVPGAELMTPEAANAILKVLEEPPANNVFVLTAQRVEDLLPTIVSRCRHIRFSPLSRQLILDALGDMDEDEKSVVATLAGGSLARAKEIRDSELMALRRNAVDALTRGKELSGRDIFDASRELGGGFQHAADAILWWLRDLMVVKATGSARHALNKERADDLESHARKVGFKELFEMFRLVEMLKAAVRFLNVRSNLAALECLNVYLKRVRPWERVGYRGIWRRW